jgi:hypothetical protein
VTGSNTILAISHYAYSVKSLWVQSSDTEFHYNSGSTGRTASTILRKLSLFIPYREIDIPNGQIDQPASLVAIEVNELRLV